MFMNDRETLKNKQVEQFYIVSFVNYKCHVRTRNVFPLSIRLICVPRLVNLRKAHQFADAAIPSTFGPG